MPETKMQTLPLLPLKNSTLFPGLLMPLSVGRSASRAAVEAALTTEEKELIVVAQRDPSVDQPDPEGLYTIGTRARIQRTSHPSEDRIDILVLGVERVVIVKVDQTGNYMAARVQTLPLPDDSSNETEALSLSIVVMGLDVAREQALLEAPSRLEALRLVHGWLSHEIEVLNLRNKITEEARGEMSREQREYILRQQKRAIEQELGEKNSDQSEIEQLREKLQKADLPEDVRKE